MCVTSIVNLINLYDIRKSMRKMSENPYAGVENKVKSLANEVELLKDEIRKT